MKKKKVYCSECKWLYITEWKSIIEDINYGIINNDYNYFCGKEVKKKFVDTWLDKEEVFQTNDPAYINKNNNCKWFEKK